MTEKDSKAYMYVVECADGTLYTGYTTDVERRLKTHNAGKGAKYTRARLPVKLLYSEAFASKPEAMSAEALFKKKSREKKLAYIKEHTEKSPCVFWSWIIKLSAYFPLIRLHKMFSSYDIFAPYY